MPNWTHDVPDEPRGHALPIRRTPSNRPLQAIITSPDLIGCYTHYWRGSTVPCQGETCPACSEGMPFRWHAYFSAVDVYNNLHFVMEVTAIAAKHFTDYRDLHGTLRGCHFIAKRWNNRPNGRILIQTKPADLAQHHLPNPPDLAKCMAIIWSLPADDVLTQNLSPENRTKQVTLRPQPPEQQ